MSHVSQRVDDNSPYLPGLLREDSGLTSVNLWRVAYQIVMGWLLNT